MRIIPQPVKRFVARHPLVTAATFAAAAAGGSPLFLTHTDTGRALGERVGLFESPVERFRRNPFALPRTLREAEIFVETFTQRPPVEILSPREVRNRMNDQNNVSIGMQNIRRKMQTEIDSARRAGQRILLIFGETHASAIQSDFFMELISGLDGVDLLSLEKPHDTDDEPIVRPTREELIRWEALVHQHGNNLPLLRRTIETMPSLSQLLDGNIQWILDSYRAASEEEKHLYLALLKMMNTNPFGVPLPRFPSSALRKSTIYADLAELAGGKGWKIVAVDLPGEQHKSVRSVIGEYRDRKPAHHDLMLRIRDAHMAGRLLLPQPAWEVAVHFGGAAHNDDLPRFFPEDIRVVTVDLSGGPSDGLDVLDPSPADALLTQLNLSEPILVSFRGGAIKSYFAGIPHH